MSAFVWQAWNLWIYRSGLFGFDFPGIWSDNLYSISECLSNFVTCFLLVHDKPSSSKEILLYNNEQQCEKLLHVQHFESTDVLPCLSHKSRAGLQSAVSDAIINLCYNGWLLMTWNSFQVWGNMFFDKLSKYLVSWVFKAVFTFKGSQKRMR